MARAVSQVWETYCLRPVGDSASTILPVFLYGTAWKKDRTADLVYTAVNAGFRAIDTAAQPRHYQENLVGDGIRKAIADGVVRREDLYVSGSQRNPPTSGHVLTGLSRCKQNSAPSRHKTRIACHMIQRPR